MPRTAVATDGTPGQDDVFIVDLPRGLIREFISELSNEGCEVTGGTDARGVDGHEVIRARFMLRPVVGRSSWDTSVEETLQRVILDFQQRSPNAPVFIGRTARRPGDETAFSPLLPEP